MHLHVLQPEIDGTNWLRIFGRSRSLSRPALLSRIVLLHLIILQVILHRFAAIFRANSELLPIRVKGGSRWPYPFTYSYVQMYQTFLCVLSQNSPREFATSQPWQPPASYEHTGNFTARKRGYISSIIYLIQKDGWALAGQRCKCDLTLFIHHG